MTSLLRFGLKAGIFGGAVYYSNKIGVWDDNSSTYIANSIRKELPIKVTDLPSSDDICRTLTENWNKGVIVSIEFTRNLPALASYYINKGVVEIVSRLD